MNKCPTHGFFWEERCLKCSTQMSDQPKPIGEPCDCEGYNEDGRLICQKERGHDSEIPMPKPTGEWTAEHVRRLGGYIDWTLSGCEKIADSHNADLAAEREKWIGHGGALAGAAVEEIQQLHEKVQTLVDALTKVRGWLQRNEQGIQGANLLSVRQNREWQKELDALAKVKEGKQLSSQDKKSCA